MSGTSRRVLLRLGWASVLAGTAGCLTSGSSRAPSPTPDPYPSTPPPLTPKPFPDRPETVTRESALEYVQAYERAYKWNEMVTDRHARIGIGWADELVEQPETGDGYSVYLAVGLSVDMRDGGHGDGAYYVGYSIDDRRLRREEGHSFSGIDPNSGDVVERWAPARPADG